MFESRDDVMRDAENKMKKAVSVNQEDLASIRSGRATPALLNKITVDYYGTQTPLIQVANVSVPEPRLMVIAPYDKSSISAIEKSINASDLGITPNNDGTVIRLAFPQLTEDRRKEMIKLAHVRAEDGRVAIRGVRRHAKQELERMKKEGILSEDEERAAENQLQKLTDKYVHEVDENLKRKEAELSEV
ncbi:MAG: ribosome recycling factor [Actinomycetota bacterium]|nr:ribosome recycling factor [Actinomycetota bacterium]